MAKTKKNNPVAESVQKADKRAKSVPRRTKTPKQAVPAPDFKKLAKVAALIAWMKSDEGIQEARKLGLNDKEITSLFKANDEAFGNYSLEHKKGGGIITFEQAAAIKENEGTSALEDTISTFEKTVSNKANPYQVNAFIERISDSPFDIAGFPIPVDPLIAFLSGSLSDDTLSETTFEEAVELFYRRYDREIFDEAFLQGVEDLRQTGLVQSIEAGDEKKNQ